MKSRYLININIAHLEKFNQAKILFKIIVFKVIQRSNKYLIKIEITE